MVTRTAFLQLLSLLGDQRESRCAQPALGLPGSAYAAQVLSDPGAIARLLCGSASPRKYTRWSFVLNGARAWQDGNEASSAEDAEEEKHRREQDEREEQRRKEREDNEKKPTSRIVAYSDSESDDEHPGPFMARRVTASQRDEG